MNETANNVGNVENSSVFTTAATTATTASIAAASAVTAAAIAGAASSAGVVSSPSSSHTTDETTAAAANEILRIKQEDGVTIRDLEHLYYYREFRRAFVKDEDVGVPRFSTDPCIGCGFQVQYIPFHTAPHTPFHMVEYPNLILPSPHPVHS